MCFVFLCFVCYFLLGEASESRSRMKRMWPVLHPTSLLRSPSSLCFQHLCLPFRPLPHLTRPLTCGNSTGLNDPTLPRLPPTLLPFQKQRPAVLRRHVVELLVQLVLGPGGSERGRRRRGGQRGERGRAGALICARREIYVFCTQVQETTLCGTRFQCVFRRPCFGRYPEHKDQIGPGGSGRGRAQSRRGVARCAHARAVSGWQYLSNATCLIKPHVLIRHY